MNIENEIKLDFKDVLIRPKRSSLTSRSDVTLDRTFTFKYSKYVWSGVPIIAANMDTVGTLGMFASLQNSNMITALHKHYSSEDLKSHFTGAGAADVAFRNSSYSFYSMGISDAEYTKFATIYDEVANSGNEIKMVCVDVANGYTEAFVAFIEKLRARYPRIIIMAGNVVTAEMTEQLIIAGADIVKVGIGPGSVCTTRKMAGVGYPQLSAIMECAIAAHGLGGLVCGDGGCTVPGDIAKAFGAGADFVMLGGMLAGHDQSGGDIIMKSTLTGELDNATGLEMIETTDYKVFYGMSSDTAMNKHNGGVANYRASEGKTVEVKYRGDVAATIQSILGGLRSACTYVGAATLKDFSRRVTFVRVTQQLNDVFGKSE